MKTSNSPATSFQLAIHNKTNGFQILELFLEYRPGSLEVMESLVKYTDELDAPLGKVAF